MATLTAEIYGPTYEEQIRVAEKVREVFLASDGVVDVDWTVAAEHSQVRAAISQAEALRAGTNPQQIAQSIAASVGGAQVGLLHDENAAEPVAIRLQHGRLGVGHRLRPGVACPWPRPGEPGSWEPWPSWTASRLMQPIHHKNLRPVVYVTADVAGSLESPAYAMIQMGDPLEEALRAWSGTGAGPRP